MAQILFISDLHLSPDHPEITDALLHFLLTTAAGAEALYILGDLFDAWVGDDDDTAEYLRVATALKTYQASGPTVFFMHGNRDFLLGEEFAEHCGMTLLQDPTIIDLPQGKALLMHGDSLCTKDHEYMSFREMVRAPEWQQAIMEKSLDERKALAAQLRSTSQSMNSMKAEDIMDVTPEEVTKMMEEYHCQLLIHGHTHRPARHTVDLHNTCAERIVLGDWHQQGWYLASDAKSLELCSFPIVHTV